MPITDFKNAMEKLQVANSASEKGGVPSYFGLSLDLGVGIYMVLGAECDSQVLCGHTGVERERQMSTFTSTFCRQTEREREKRERPRLPGKSTCDTRALRTSSFSLLFRTRCALRGRERKQLTLTENTPR